MGELIRLLMLALLAWLGWRWLTRLSRSDDSTASPTPADRPASTASAAPTQMVRCSQCDLHLPSTEAFLYQGHYFCCQQHQSAFLQKQQQSQGKR